MSKRHFIALADMIRATQGQHTEFSVAQVHAVADWCEQQNPRFNRQRWLGYVGGLCGPNGGQVKGRAA